jgi:amino acid permease
VRYFRETGGSLGIVSFLLGALVALTVMWALAEMSWASDSRRRCLHAEMYASLGGLCGRYTLAVPSGDHWQRSRGGAIQSYWFPNAPAWLWIAGFSMAMICINT